MDRKININIEHLLNPDDEGEHREMMPIITDGDDSELENVEIPELLPLLPLRNNVLFPGVVLPISIGRPKSVQLIKDAYRTEKQIATFAQRDPDTDDPAPADLHPTGTLGQIVKLLEMPDGSTTAIIQGRTRIELAEIVSSDPYFMARVEPRPEARPVAHNKEFDAIVGSLKDLSMRIIKLNPNVNPEASFAVKNIENNTYLINFICSNTDIKVADKQRLLESNSLRDRGFLLLEYLVKEVQLLELKNELQSKVKIDIDQQQREYLLHQQMKTIQNELGGNPLEKEIEEYRKKAKEKKWNDD
ncbi:MAG: endopeptidase La, partial [Bacteroidetes bacterium]|nr:endopeptidase La [Bacteroidota bacterium]